jgi:hypothetical protein
MVEQRDSEQTKLNAPVGCEHPDEAENQVYGDSNRVLNPEGVNVCRALEFGVEDICKESCREKTEEPFAA